MCVMFQIEYEGFLCSVFCWVLDEKKMCCNEWCVFVFNIIWVSWGLFDGLVDVVGIFWGE